MSNQVTPDKMLDTKGTVCPTPIVMTSQAIKEVQIGGVLEVLATDPGSKSDLTVWAKKTGNELLCAEELGGTPTVFRVLIRRLK